MSPGSGATVRVVLVESQSLWVAATNSWVVAPEPGGLAVVIDAPPDPSGIAELLARFDLTPVALLVTHGHIDHVGGAAGVESMFGISTYVHPDDDFLSLDPAGQLRMLFGMVPPGDHRPPERRVAIEDGELLAFGGLEFEVRLTPGHTPGHCCFHLRDEGILFSGDQLFAGSIGRTDLPGGDFATLLRSMRDRVLDLPDEVRVLPGHGPETTIGRERRTNPFLTGAF